MLALDLPAEPYRLDLPRGVRVEIRPVMSAVTAATQAFAAGAPRGALAIQTAGWYPNAVAVGAGDHIGIAGQLYMATERVTASGTGTATIPVAPPLRAAAPIGEPLVLTRASCRCDSSPTTRPPPHPARPLHRHHLPVRGGAVTEAAARATPRLSLQAAVSASWWARNCRRPSPASQPILRAFRDWLLREAPEQVAGLQPRA